MDRLGAPPSTVDNSNRISRELKREVGLFSAAILVVANMVGTGILTTSGFIIEEVGDPAALLWCWIVGGFFALSGALCYGELGTLFPLAGGEYVYLRQSFGPTMAFLSGWISLVVGFSAPIAAAAIAFSTYFFRAFSVPPADATAPFFSIFFVVVSPVVLLACATIIFFSLVHTHSLWFGSRVQNVLTIFKVLLIGAFITAGLCLGDKTMSLLPALPRIDTIVSSHFAGALIFVAFAYSGWNAVGYIGSEIKNPGRNIPLALLIGTTVVIALYLLLNLVYLYALPAAAMSGAVEIGEIAAAALFGEQTSRYVAGAIAIGLLSVISAMILAGPRVYYAMAHDGVFFKLFGKVTEKRRTPVYSIMLQGFVSIAMVLTASFGKLLYYIGFTLSLFAMLTVCGLMILRKRQPGSHAAYRTWGYPITPLLFIAGNLWIISHSIIHKPMIALYGFGTIALGLAACALFSQKSHPSLCP